MQRHIRRMIGTTLAAGLIWTACDQGSPVAPDNVTDESAVAFDFGPDGLPGAEEFEVCKIGTSANFDWEIDGVPQTGFSLAAGECSVIHQVGGSGATVMVRERTEDFTNEQLDQVMVEVLDQTGTTGPFAGTNPYTDIVGGAGVANGPRGVTVTFYNSLIPVGGEGCTPGYWRQPHHFDSWEGYLPGDNFDDVFDPDGVGLESPETGTTASLTLAEALRLRGGGVNALIRHAVAALLNAASSGVDYDLTTGDVLAKYTAAINGGDIEGQKNEFATFNEQGCPLN